MRTQSPTLMRRAQSASASSSGYDTGRAYSSPDGVVIRYGCSSLTQSHTYRMPASASNEGVRRDSPYSGPNHPATSDCVAAPTTSTDLRMYERSSASVMASVTIRLTDQPWAMYSAPAALQCCTRIG